eukprot:CAMPEP_0182546480 /NCGR_PEP_ID=MMETSP1323-20130603/36088_1 /TAXON_ID=236787 /ORGANISM="Florenciella parvula, Strain RCC1693" /LENGTH=37 /DNA_ID= /DNA_START= /DNA_END= /DNA_ORIENTATION=
MRRCLVHGTPQCALELTVPHMHAVGLVGVALTVPVLE